MSTAQLAKLYGWERTVIEPGDPNPIYERTTQRSGTQQILKYDSYWEFRPCAQHAYEAYQFKTLKKAIEYAEKCEVG